MLLHEQDLEFMLPLAGARRSKEYSALPSWAPQMNEPDGASRLAMIHTHDTERMRYNASAGASSNTRVFGQESPPTALTFSIIYVNEVETYGEVLDFRHLDSEDHLAEQNSWEQAARDLVTENRVSDPYQNAQPLSEALWRTFMGDMTKKERPAPREYAEPYQSGVHMRETGYSMLSTDIMRAWFCAYGLKCTDDEFRTLWKKHYSIKILDSITRKKRMPDVDFWVDIFARHGLTISKDRIRALAQQIFDEDADKIRGLTTEYGDLALMVLKACAGKKFVVMKTGYIGLVPRDTEKGDVIAVFLGAQTPFVLKKFDSHGYVGGEGRHFKLIGECYVHGIMDGEMVSSQIAKVEDAILH